MDVANVSQAEHDDNYLAAFNAVKQFAGRFTMERAFSVEAAGRVADGRKLPLSPAAAAGRPAR